ncbi:hypothetical protein Tco_1209550 [Tanacetum coccineum]
MIPAHYPADRDDNDDDDEDEDEEEEEHPDPADSVPPVERLLALTTPPPSPLTPLSSPLPQIPSPPLPIPSPPPNSPTHIEIPESCLPLRKRGCVLLLPPLVMEETTIMYGIMEDAQDDRSQLRGRVNLLYRDRPVHSHIEVAERTTTYDGRVTRGSKDAAKGHGRSA